ncbi:MAG: hypothetical protein HKO89_00435 [Saprospiraceae bacterium]|nr:hypothetical protein [Saprospiraceae bacterium]
MIKKSIENVLVLYHTLSTQEDKLWPKENWPKMIFKDGLEIGSEGSHGPIRYKVLEYEKSGRIVFEFKKPNGFNGIHKFEISEIDPENTLIEHTIDMTTSGFGTIKWLLAIRSLHDALIEDAFDKIQEHFDHDYQKAEWSPWVRTLRAIFK